MSAKIVDMMHNVTPIHMPIPTKKRARKTELCSKSYETTHFGQVPANIFTAMENGADMAGYIYTKDICGYPRAYATDINVRRNLASLEIENLFETTF